MTSKLLAHRLDNPEFVQKDKAHVAIEDHSYSHKQTMVQFSRSKLYRSIPPHQQVQVIHRARFGHQDKTPAAIEVQCHRV
jgi:hypothetical protein